MRRPHLTAAGPHDECGAAHNSAAGLSALGGGIAGGRVRALYGNRLVLYPSPTPHPSRKKRPALTDLKLDGRLLIWARVQVRPPSRHQARIGLLGQAVGWDEGGGCWDRAPDPHHTIIAPQGSEGTGFRSLGGGAASHKKRI